VNTVGYVVATSALHLPTFYSVSDALIVNL